MKIIKCPAAILEENGINPSRELCSILYDYASQYFPENFDEVINEGSDKNHQFSVSKFDQKFLEMYRYSQLLNQVMTLLSDGYSPYQALEMLISSLEEEKEEEIYYTKVRSNIGYVENLPYRNQVTYKLTKPLIWENLPYKQNKFKDKW